MIHSLTVASNLSELEQVLEWFAQARPAGVPEISWLQLELALAEAFTNAVRHAHQLLPNQPAIVLEFCSTPDYLELKVWDHGPEFDLEGCLQNLPEIIAPDQDGGRGLKLLQNIADQLQYQRLGQQNCLILRKNLP